MPIPASGAPINQSWDCAQPSMAGTLRASLRCAKLLLQFCSLRYITSPHETGKAAILDFGCTMIDGNRCHRNQKWHRVR